MIYSDVKESLKKQADGADFITVTQVGRCLGIKNREVVRNRYLNGLDKVDGRYYLISDVAHRIMERVG